VLLAMRTRAGRQRPRSTPVVLGSGGVPGRSVDPEFVIDPEQESEDHHRPTLMRSAERNRNTEQQGRDTEPDLHSNSEQEKRSGHARRPGNRS